MAKVVGLLELRNRVLTRVLGVQTRGTEDEVLRGALVQIPRVELAHPIHRRLLRRDLCVRHEGVALVGGYQRVPVDLSHLALVEKNHQGDLGQQKQGQAKTYKEEKPKKSRIKSQAAVRNLTFPLESERTAVKSQSRCEEGRRTALGHLDPLLCSVNVGVIAIWSSAARSSMDERMFGRGNIRGIT
eukprot:jgi/Bigna1/68409/fgenesh1_pg.6_\